MFKKVIICFCLCFCYASLHIMSAYGQEPMLSLKEAVRIGLENYPAIRARQSQVSSSRAYLTETKTEYLPNVSLQGQQDYGTINSLYGPQYGLGGLGTSSAGPVTENQNWNAAFGALYLTNVNWDFFAFGRALEKIKVQKSVVVRDEKDLGQQQFQHEIRVASAYLNVVAAQRLVKVQQDNLKRTLDIRTVVVARVKNGLNPGVDSSQVNAEVSNAKIALTNAQQNEQEQVNMLSQYLGMSSPPKDFKLDTTFVSRNPANPDPAPSTSLDNHPTLQYYRSLVGLSDEQVKYYRTFAYPTFTFFGVFQGRGTGFKTDLATSISDYTTNYGTGVDPTRWNYLLGIGLTWNLTTIFRTKYQVRSQKFISEEYQHNYEGVSEQLQNQMSLAETRIFNSLKNASEAPVEIKAANDAYVQKTTLYRNGLATITDYTTALYALFRAETDSYIAYNNVWQALLYKAATSGDFNIFINNF